MTAGGACAGCGASEPPATVAAATLTPPPQDDETHLGTPTAIPQQSDVAGPLSLGQPFGHRYRILRVLGAGGMGVVYHAWDEELGVAVALKVIRPEVMADPVMGQDVERRFKRELLLGRQVTHKNVIRIHDLGDVAGVKYLTMPFVEGVDLASILRDASQLPVPRALGIAREIAAGLAAAHDAGVIHRDLKPENIMVEGEHFAQIMDFGISRSARPVPLTRELGPGDSGAGIQQLDEAAVMSGLTIAGAVIGTLRYMAPELAKGQEPDQRADIYAFGLIFRDMLIGPRRYAGQNPLEELKARTEQPLAGVRSIDEQIPEPIDRIIGRCLERDPTARYQSVHELIADLDGLDAEGHLLPKVRHLTRRLIGGVAIFVLALLGATWWLARTPAEDVQPPPMSVLIADFDNRANDPLFEGSLEQALSAGMEGASFITAYPRRDAQRLAAEIKPGTKLDEPTARLVSIREGVKVILAGSIAPRGSGYELAVKAIDPTNGTAFGEASARARDKAHVLDAVRSIASGIRRTLGDTAPERGFVDAGETFTTASLEAARLYEQAQALQDGYRDAEAIDLYKRAIALDPNFSRAFASWGNSASRLGRKEEAEEAWRKALSMVDRMTEREKYRTLGVYYGTMTRNYDMAIDNYKELVKRYPADDTGHNNLAVSYFNGLNFAEALEEGRKAVEIYPKGVLYRGNYALYAMYASDFATAAREARQVIAQDAAYYPAYLPIAVSALAASNRDGAHEAYAGMKKAGAAGESVATTGLADLAMYEGRYAEARQLLEEGIAKDQKAQNEGGMAFKYVALAEVHAAEGRRPRAIEMLRTATKVRRDDGVLVPAARLFATFDRPADALALAKELGNEFRPQSRAYGKIIEAEVALNGRRFIEAVELMRGSRQLADLWLGHLILGRTYIEAGHHAEALSELETCQKRLGEGSAMFLDDLPTFRYVATLPYWLGRAHEGLGAASAAAENYKKYLSVRGRLSADPLVADATRRLGEL